VYISHTHIIAASKTAFFVWYYRTPSRLAAPELTQISSRKGREGHDRLIHVDDHPSEASPHSVEFKKATIVSDEQ
jgi:WD repeat-containing protein 35